MTETLEVYVDSLGETRLVGLCRYADKFRSQSSIFEYADEWLTYRKPFALDPANLPLSPHPVYSNSEKSALPGPLRDSAPDRWGRQLIHRAFRRSGEKRSLSEIDYLLAMKDATRIGALRYRRAGESHLNFNIGEYQTPPLTQMSALLNAVDAVLNNTETTDDLHLLLNQGSPLGGARPKSAVVDKDGQLAIAKFPKLDDDRSITHGEILALTLAKQAGINTACGRIEVVAGRSVALIRRFDRAEHRRIPFLSAMSLLGINDGDIATYTDIAESIRMHSISPIQDLCDLWRRMIFGVMIGNVDDHLRNHGFLYAGDGKWQLSPAYDLNPVPLEESVRELTTWISEEGPQASIDLARRAAPYFALKANQADQIIIEVSQVIAKWREVARQLGMSAVDIDAYASAFESAEN